MRVEYSKVAADEVVAWNGSHDPTVCAPEFAHAWCHGTDCSAAYILPGTLRLRAPHAIEVEKRLREQAEPWEDIRKAIADELS